MDKITSDLLKSLYFVSNITTFEIELLDMVHGFGQTVSFAFFAILCLKRFFGNVPLFVINKKY